MSAPDLLKRVVLLNLIATNVLSSMPEVRCARASCGASVALSPRAFLASSHSLPQVPGIVPPDSYGEAKTYFDMLVELVESTEALVDDAVLQREQADTFVAGGPLTARTAAHQEKKALSAKKAAWRRVRFAERKIAEKAPFMATVTVFKSFAKDVLGYNGKVGGKDVALVKATRTMFTVVVLVSEATAIDAQVTAESFEDGILSEVTVTVSKLKVGVVRVVAAVVSLPASVAQAHRVKGPGGGQVVEEFVLHWLAVFELVENVPKHLVEGSNLEAVALLDGG